MAVGGAGPGTSISEEAEAGPCACYIALDHADWVRVRNQFKRFKGFYLKAKARIWPWLSDMCHIRSTAVARPAFSPASVYLAQPRLIPTLKLTDLYRIPGASTWE